ncbi:MAG: YfhO family protein, partial [Clostridiaceae bacterium]|nr:YfhO family protein [Clostridiaceae bacterium]
HYPNQLPYRYSFLYSFVLVIIAVRALMNLRYLKKGIALGAGSLLIVVIVLAEVLFKDKVPPESVYVSIVFIVIYILAMRPRTRRRLSYSLAALFLCIMVLCESLVSSILLLNQVGKNEGFTSHEGYTGDLAAVTNVIEAVKKNDPGFWRLEILPAKSTDDPALYNYNGLTIFSSTVNKPTAQSMRNMGFHGNNINSYKYVNSTALTDMLFGIRYRISKNQSWNDPRWTNLAMTEIGVNVDGDKNPYLYKNDEALTPLWFIHEEPDSLRLRSQNAFENLQTLLTAADPSLSDVVNFQKIEVLSGLNVTPRAGSERNGYRFDLENNKKDTQVTVYIDVTEDSWQYFHIDTSRRTEIRVWRESDNEFYVEPTTVTDDPMDESSEKKDIDDRRTVSVNKPDIDKGESSEPPASRTTGGNIQSRNMRVPEMIDAGFVKAGDRVTLHVKQNADDATAFTLYSANLTAAGLTRAYETIAPQMLQNIRWNSRYLIGELTAPKDGYAFATIPWDRGWKVSVNGLQVTPVSVQNAWLAIPVKEGVNRIEMCYTPPGFETGLIATVLSLLGLVFIVLLTAAIRLKRDERRRRKREAAARITLSDIRLPDREE